jgi:hypothetical protein
MGLGKQTRKKIAPEFYLADVTLVDTHFLRSDDVVGLQNNRLGEFETGQKRTPTIG